MARIHRIGILEDHIATAMGYQSQLTTNDALEVCWTANYYNEVETFLAEKLVDLLILDVGVKNQPGDTEPYPILHVIPKLLESYPELKIIVITMHNRPALIRAIKEAGASGYILKDDIESFRRLDEILLDIAHEGIYFSPQAERKITRTESPTLTRRQGEILSYLASYPAISTQQLADHLHISPSTVRNHLSDIYIALGVNRLSSAVIKARQLGLITSIQTEELPQDKTPNG